MCNGTPFTIEKISPRAGLELGTARSVGHRLTHSATGATDQNRMFANIEKWSEIGYNKNVG